MLMDPLSFLFKLISDTAAAASQQQQMLLLLTNH
jgi:hypothetical protein